MVYCGLGIIIYRLREEADIIWEEGDCVIALKAVYFASQLFSPLILNGQEVIVPQTDCPCEQCREALRKVIDIYK